MNRNDFMDQLESLLQNISSTEREEALQFYEGYFDDAGKENEQEVIEALGNPARVAENIKRDLLGNGGVEGAARKVRACDRVLVEYGKESQEEETPDGMPGYGEESERPELAETQSGAATGGKSLGTSSHLGTQPTFAGGQGGQPGFGSGTESRTAFAGGQGGQPGFGSGTESRTAFAGGQGGQPGFGSGTESRTASAGSKEGQAGGGFGAASDMFSSADWMGSDPQSWQFSQSGQYGESGQFGGTGQYGESGQFGATGGCDGFGQYGGVGQPGGDGGYGESGQPGKPGSALPGWAVALLVVALLPACPLVLGIFGTLLGLLASWFAMIFGFGVTALVLLVVLVVLVVAGFICMFANPWVGTALVGGGLLCGALGIVFLMLTVAMAGIVTPAVFKGIKYIFKRAKGRI